MDILIPKRKCLMKRRENAEKCTKEHNSHCDNALGVGLFYQPRGKEIND